MSKLYFARRSFGYGDVNLDPGQVVSLGGFKNDEKLVRLGYLAESTPGVSLVQCKFCGGKFVSDSQLNAHGLMRHPGKDVSLPEQDARSEQWEARQEQEAPLYLDKTAASREGEARARRRAGAR